MVFAIGLVLGALVFSLLDSLLSSIRESRPRKTAYQVWMDEIAKNSVVRPRSDFSNFE